MPRVRVRVLSSVLAVAALVGLAGCSSDDKKSDSGTTTSVVSATPTTRVYTGDPNSIFCTLARENSTRVSQIGGAVSNPEQLAALLEEVAPAVREIVKVSPPELKDDVNVLADGFEKMLASAKDGQIDLTILTDPKFQSAGQNLASYGQQVCGITG
jgi:ABC-type Fe3+-hydroxamate transport system substrate-binding protein